MAKESLLRQDHYGPGPNVSPAMISYLWVSEIITT